MALRFLAGDNLEHRLAAARFLERSLTLARLAQEVDLGDREGFERSYELLRKACDVGVAGFLRIVERTSRPATLLLCARLLATTGSRQLIPNLARKVFSLSRSGREDEELYRATVGAVARRGSEAALSNLNREMLRRAGDSRELAIILAELPERGEHIFEDALLSFFKDPDFVPASQLREAIRRVIPGAAPPCSWTSCTPSARSGPTRCASRPSSCWRSWACPTAFRPCSKACRSCPWRRRWSSRRCSPGSRARS